MLGDDVLLDLVGSAVDRGRAQVVELGRDGALVLGQRLGRRVEPAQRIVTQRGKPVGAIQVEVEETLGHYAEWLGTKASQIRQLNGLSYGRTLHLNQKLKIPLHRVTKEEFEEKRFEYHQELAEDFFASYRIEKVLTYIIKRGDNVWTLSHQEFEVPLWLIKRYNAGVDFNALIPSQELLIPVIEKNA